VLGIFVLAAIYGFGLVTGGRDRLGGFESREMPCVIIEEYETCLDLFSSVRR
jgi:hypothetical protein